MALWREWNLVSLLRKELEKGKIMCGISAGMICWFSEGLSDSVKKGDFLPLKNCCGFLPMSACPHYSSELPRREKYEKCIVKGELCSGYAADDDVALHFLNGKFVEAVTYVNGRCGYFVTATTTNEAKTEVISARLLTKD